MQRLQEVVRRAEMSQGGGMKLAQQLTAMEVLPPLHFPHISPVSPLYLAQQLTAMEVRHEDMRHTSPLYLPYISPISPL